MPVTLDQLILIVLGLVVVERLLGPGRCLAPKERAPYHPCRRPGAGLIWKCRYHGRHPYIRLMARFGGVALAHRRVCEKCKSRTTFARFRKDGKPFLGCDRHPACTGIRFLA